MWHIRYWYEYDNDISPYHGLLIWHWYFLLTWYFMKTDTGMWYPIITLNAKHIEQALTKPLFFGAVAKSVWGREKVELYCRSQCILVKIPLLNLTTKPRSPCTAVFFQVSYTFDNFAERRDQACQRIPHSTSRTTRITSATTATQGWSVWSGWELWTAYKMKGVCLKSVVAFHCCW